MEKWLGRMEQIKERLLKRGIDVDATLAAHKEKQAQLKPLPQAVKRQFEKLDAQTRTVVEIVRNGGTSQVGRQGRQHFR